MASPLNTPAGRRSLLVLAWATAPVLLLAIFVQVRGVGIDLLMAALIGLMLLALERLLGALLSDRVGPFAAGVIFAAIVVGLSWFFLSSGTGRARTERFFADAERRGYRTVFYKNPHAKDSTPTAEDERARQPAPTTGYTPPARPQASSATVPVPDTSSAVNGEPREATSEAPGIAAAAADSRVGRRVRSFFTRSTGAKTATSVAISATPANPRVTQRVVLRARVSAGGNPVSDGTVEFLVNGRGAGRVFLDGRGVATTTFTPALAGSYEVRVRYAGSAELESSVATTSFSAR